MKRVGVTGGIGSGKSTVCKIWEELGAKVVYADTIAKNLMVEDQVLIDEIKKTFGEDSYHQDGSLNRDFLAVEAFEKGRVEELNALVHPRVYRKTDELAIEAEKDGYEMFVKEAALLLKNGRPEEIDLIVLVLASEEKRLQRVVKRDSSSEKEVRSRIEKQQNFGHLKPLADYIIKNDGDLENLKLKAIRIYRSILA